jgi:hypothetical protein
MILGVGSKQPIQKMIYFLYPKNSTAGLTDMKMILQPILQSIFVVVLPTGEAPSSLCVLQNCSTVVWSAIAGERIGWETR